MHNHRLRVNKLSHTHTHTYLLVYYIEITIEREKKIFFWCDNLTLTSTLVSRKTSYLLYGDLFLYAIFNEHSIDLRSSERRLEYE